MRQALAWRFSQGRARQTGEACRGLDHNHLAHDHGCRYFHQVWSAGDQPEAARSRPNRSDYENVMM
jgi:hypothetical protein